MDRSSDPSVSFQTPTHISPGQSASAVAAHENEHVVNNQQKAEQNGQVAHSTVTLSYAMCPECGRMYVAGGKTQTTYSSKQIQEDPAQSGVGRKIDTFV